MMVLMSLAFFGKGFGALGWTVIADTSPRELIGVNGGLFNLFGNIAGITTPIIIGYMVQEDPAPSTAPSSSSEPPHSSRSSATSSSSARSAASNSAPEAGLQKSVPQKGCIPPIPKVRI